MLNNTIEDKNYLWLLATQLVPILLTTKKENISTTT